MFVTPLYRVNNAYLTNYLFLLTTYLCLLLYTIISFFIKELLLSGVILILNEII